MINSLVMYKTDKIVFNVNNFPMDKNVIMYRESFPISKPKF